MSVLSGIIYLVPSSCFCWYWSSGQTDSHDTKRYSNSWWRTEKWEAWHGPQMAVSDANLSQWTLQASFAVDVRYQIAGQEIGGPVLLSKDQSWLGMQRGHFFEKLIHTNVRWSTVISKLQAVAFEVFDVSMTHTPYCTYYFHLFSPMICHSSWRYKLKLEGIRVRIQPSTAQWKQRRNRIRSFMTCQLIAGPGSGSSWPYNHVFFPDVRRAVTL